MIKKFKSIFLFICSTLFVFDNVYADTVKYISCGSQSGIPFGLPGFVRTLITAIQLIVPVLLILFGSIDFLRVVFGTGNEDWTNALKRFIPRILAGVAVFFTILLVRIFIQTLEIEDNSLLACLSCFTTDDGMCSEYEVEKKDNSSEKDKATKEREARLKKREEIRKKNEKKSNEIKDADRVDDSPTSRPGSKTIFVGDSRTVGMCGSITGKWDRCQYSSGGALVNGNDIYIAEGSMSYSWFNDTAVPEVNRIIQGNPNTTYNIISNMGVNMLLYDVDKYIAKYRELANGKWKNQNIIIASVNPVDEATERRYGYSTRQQDIITFNNKIKNGISGLSNVKYCDTYSKVINNFNTSDGLHYDVTTYKKIYNYMTSCIR